MDKGQCNQGQEVGIRPNTKECSWVKVKAGQDTAANNNSLLEEGEAQRLVLLQQIKVQAGGRFCSLRKIKSTTEFVLLICILYFH